MLEKPSELKHREHADTKAKVQILFIFWNMTSFEMDFLQLKVSETISWMLADKADDS